MSEQVVHQLKSPERVVAASIVASIFDDMPKRLAFYQNVVFEGLTIRRDEEGWVMVIKAKQGSQRVVCFTGARYWEDLAEVVAYEITHTALTWHKDKYAIPNGTKP